ncbi:MAG TPA: hypothetical protein VKU03_07350 [Roseiarcus sp.]|nr:hypothetical protein [Roseiarcus sp.]
MPVVSKPRRAKSIAAAPAKAGKPVPRKASATHRKAAAAAPADFAQQQVARLEAMFDRLAEKANQGELGAIDRSLKILDRLDRYQGFSPAAAPEESDEDARERILRILSDVDARRAAAAQEEEGEGADDAPADA